MRIELKMAYGELEQRTKEFSSLLSVSEILTSLTDLSNMNIARGRALDKTMEGRKGNIGGILLLDEAKQMLSYLVHRGLSKKHAREACYRLGEGIAGRVAQSGESIIADEIQADAVADQFGTSARDSVRWFASVPLRSKKGVMGVLLIASHEPRGFSSNDIQFLEGIARQITTAIENAKLHEEVQRKEEIRGELLREILSIQEGERSRIARELHDETSQVLASLNANLEAATGMLPASAEQAKAMLKKTQALSISLLDEIHRLIYELRPTLLDDLGLVAAARWLADNNLGTAGVAVNFKTTGQQRRLPLQLETTLFRVIQEAVTNIVRHAHAKNVNISLSFKRRSIRVHIRDDGRGFDVEEAISSKDSRRGLGLLGRMERAELMHGSVSMHSHPGGVTEVDIEIPINNKEVANG